MVSEKVVNVQLTTLKKWNKTSHLSHGLRFDQYDAAGNRLSDQRRGGVRSWAANALNQLTQQTVGGELELRGTVAPKSTVRINAQPAEMREGGAVAATGTEWRKKVNAAAGQNTFALKATEDAPPGFVPRVLNKSIEVNIQPEPQIAFAYDGDGNLVTDGFTSYEWDAESRLVGVTNSAIGRVEFFYDAFSRRVRIIEKAPATLAVEADKKLVWDGMTIVQQFDSIGNSLRKYYGHGETRQPVGISPIVVMEYLYTKDHLGSIRQLLEKTSGSQGALLDYSPYGVQTAHQASVPSDFGYTGHYTNAKTGLVLAPYRAYSPLLGRWISRDPIEEDGGINLYGYVGNQPSRFTDPLGLRPLQLVGDGERTDAERHQQMREDQQCRLPSGPNGLGPEWKPDPTHRYPNGERFTGPDGRYLDWHPGTPGKPGWGGKDHWHDTGGKQHLPPGTEVPDPAPSTKAATNVACAVGAGYIAYRIFRFIPSLAPPLWPSIPLNAVAP